MRSNHVRASVFAAMLLAGSPGLALAQNAGTATTPATTGTAATGTAAPMTGTAAVAPAAVGTNNGGGWGGGWWGLIGLIGLFGLAGGRRTRPVPPATGVGTTGVGPGNRL